MRSWQRGSQADRRKQKNDTTIRNAKKGNSKKWGKRAEAVGAHFDRKKMRNSEKGRGFITKKNI